MYQPIALALADMLLRKHLIKLLSEEMVVNPLPINAVAPQQLSLLLIHDVPFIGCEVFVFLLSVRSGVIRRDGNPSLNMFLHEAFAFADRTDDGDRLDAILHHHHPRSVAVTARLLQYSFEVSC